MPVIGLNVEIHRIYCHSQWHWNGRLALWTENIKSKDQDAVVPR